MQILRKKAAAARVGYHPVHMMRKATDPRDDFPSPIPLGPNSIGFLEEEIDAWIKSRVARRPRKRCADGVVAEQGDPAHDAEM